MSFYFSFIYDKCEKASVRDLLKLNTLDHDHDQTPFPRFDVFRPFQPQSIQNQIQFISNISNLNISNENNTSHEAYERNLSIKIPKSRHIPFSTRNRAIYLLINDEDAFEDEFISLQGKPRSKVRSGPKTKQRRTAVSSMTDNVCYNDINDFNHVERQVSEYEQFKNDLLTNGIVKCQHASSSEYIFVINYYHSRDEHVTNEAVR